MCNILPVLATELQPNFEVIMNVGRLNELKYPGHNSACYASLP